MNESSLCMNDWQAKGQISLAKGKWVDGEDGIEIQKGEGNVTEQGWKGGVYENVFWSQNKTLLWSLF